MSSAQTSQQSQTRDGRVRRSERSRKVIVDALVDLVGEGVLVPTAQEVAERAQVGIRTVFRHFKDKETLFTALAGHVRDEVGPFLLADIDEGSLIERARSMVARRAIAYEKMAPFWRAATVQRWRSKFVDQDRREAVAAFREDVRRWFPEVVGGDESLLSGLEVATSFDAWDRLRAEQSLDVEQATQTMERMTLALLQAVSD